MRRPLISALRLLLILGALSLAIASVALSTSGTTATSIPLAEPTAAAPIPSTQGGGFYIADTRNDLVLKVDAAGFITTMAGDGTPGSGGDGGPATKAQLATPTDAVPTADGGILITDSRLFSSTGTPRIRRVSPSGTITTVAGGASEAEAESCSGHTDKFGDGCQATKALLSIPTAAVPVAGGGFLIAEFGFDDVRQVDASGVITRVAGSDVSNPTLCPAHTDELGDGCPAVGAPGHGALLQGPTAAIPFNIEGAAVTTPGTGFLITEEQGCRVRYVNGSGVITTVAGITSPSNSCRENGEAAPPVTGTATALRLELPTDARPTSEAGVFLIADGHSCSVYRVNMTTNKYTRLSSDPTCAATEGLGTTAAIPDASGGSLVSNATASLIYHATVEGVETVVAGGGTGGSRPPDGTPNGAGTTTTTTTTPTAPAAGVTPSPPSTTPPKSSPPSCRITSRSGAIPLSTHKRTKGSKLAPQPKDTLAVAFVCNQAARVTLRGAITELIKHSGKTTKKKLAIGPRVVNVHANVSFSTTLLVPTSALKTLKHGVAESAALALAASNAQGASNTTAKIAKLSTRR